MTDRGNLSERLLSRRVVPEDDTDGCDDCGGFGYLRGARDRAAMIDFRFLNGSREAFPYATLERVSFNPSEGLILRFMGVRVVLRGRNFAAPPPSGVSFLEAVQRHRVPWVQEVEELRGTLMPAEAVVVTGIEVIEGR